MKNSFGSAISVTLFGESHGAEIGAVIDGVAPGIKVDYEYINAKLDQRRPYGKISTARREKDEFRIVSGVYNGYTTGTPIAILIPNENTKSCDYNALRDTPRPSHADYVAEIKYHGFQDTRGGGHFSGRITAALVAAGAIVNYALQNKGIYIGTHISSLCSVMDECISSAEDARSLSDKIFPTVSPLAEEKMKEKIESAAAMGDSVGGILESAVYGMPAGVGEPFFDSMESVLSHALFSVPAIKGVEFGAGFKVADMYGSEANDPFTVEDGTVKTKTNNSGGINGGITNGMPIIFRCAVKPTPSIYKEQDSISMSELTNKKIKIEGRHDPAIIHRVRAVVDAVTALTLADMLTVRYGTDYLR